MAQMPHNLEAEKNVLGCIMADNRLAGELEALQADDFYAPQTRATFAAMVDLYKKRQEISLITLAPYIQDIQALTDIAGIVTLQSFAASLREVKAYGKRRAFLDILESATHRAMQPGEDIDSLTFDTERQILGLGTQSGTLQPFSDVLFDTLGEIEKRKAAGGRIPGTPTGLECLDVKLGGLEKGYFYVLGARPAMGKTALALQIATSVAKTLPVLVFELEMTKVQIGTRILSTASGTAAARLKFGTYNEEEARRLAAAYGRLEKHNMLIDDTSCASITEIISRARKVKTEHPDLGLIVVDHIGLISHGKKTFREGIEDVTRRLKALAKELACPVMALSQLSRNVEYKDNKRPSLNDLRESGSIEQDADVVLLLYREEYYHKDTDHKNICEVIVAKARDANTGTVLLHWEPTCLRFRSIEMSS